MRTQNHIVALVRPKKDGADLTRELTLGQLLAELPDLDTNVQEAAVVNIEAARLRSRVRALPVLERKVIAARYGLVGEALSCRQLAARLGISPSNVSAIEHRALDRLRGMYGLPEAA